MCSVSGRRISDRRIRRLASSAIRARRVSKCRISLPLAEVAGRFDDRTRLLAALDRLERDVDRQQIDSHDRSCRQAIELISSPAARTAFDLTRGAGAVRDRYGRHCWGQRALLARRLVEAGCSFVTMVLENPVSVGRPVALRRDVQLGLARGQLPHLQRPQGAVADLRPGGDGARRGPVRARAR